MQSAVCSLLHIIWVHVRCRMEGAAESSLIHRYAAPEEVVELPSHCSACGSPSTARMYQTHIPFFKVTCPPISSGHQ